ncbi:GNAT family N-acetyltransferase [Alkalibacillus aidingensis]|uniref:GNAT family N-acetyltransferase n=1 Tax=Alkalibacillus aidingensis TaxID=2747607 RepID=UPI001661037B|nr:GNAT family N-acetyltransferase [Alkalibacillus aidingensis]
MKFIPINPIQHREVTITFRRDSYKVSFGHDRNFDDEEYIKFLDVKVSQFPSGFVLVKERGEFIGQLELSIRLYEGRQIGYVHLFYLIPKERGTGKGFKLYSYAKDFFEKHHVNEFHLRVSPTNKRARRYYEKMGMRELKPEVNGKVIRMVGEI